MEILLDHLSLHRAGRPILQDICWHVRSGERWLVVGGSGAGKTQLLKIVAGDVWPDEGAHPSRRYHLHDEWHDQPAEVRDEIAWLGPERQDRYERYGWDFPAIDVVGTGLLRADLPQGPLTAAERTRCLALLRAAGIARLAGRRFLTLSYGERRLVLLARALAWQAQVVLLDEVATGLDGANQKRLYALLSARRRRHSTWICSAHRAEDVPPGATHLLWLHGGSVRYAGRSTPGRLREALALTAAGADPGKPVARSGAKPRRTPEKAARAVMEMRDADVWIDERHILRGVSLVVNRGDCWVLHGANGSGKSTLLRTLYGDHAVASTGSIRRAGVVSGVPLDRFRSRTGLIAPHLQTDYPRFHSVLDTVVSGLHSSIGLNFPATAAELRRARASLRRFDLLEFADRSLNELSYGQMRRVLFARAAVLRPRLLLLDEPFTGLNAPLRRSLLDWLEDEIDAGVTVVMASHYRSEWPRNATHEMLLSRGRATYLGTMRR